MKKRFVYSIGIGVFLIACILPFCRGDKEVAFNDIQKIAEKMVSKHREDFVEEDIKFVRKMYQLQDQEYMNIICYGAPSAMEVNELCIVQYENEQQKDNIKERLQTRLDGQYKSFSGYAPRQADVLKNASLYDKKSYVIFIVHKDSEDIKEEIDALF